MSIYCLYTWVCRKGYDMFALPNGRKTVSVCSSARRAEVAPRGRNAPCCCAHYFWVESPSWRNTRAARRLGREKSTDSSKSQCVQFWECGRIKGLLGLRRHAAFMKSRGRKGGARICLCFSTEELHFCAHEQNSKEAHQLVIV